MKRLEGACSDLAGSFDKVEGYRAAESPRRNETVTGEAVAWSFQEDENTSL